MMSQADISADMMRLRAKTKKNGEGRNERKAIAGPSRK